MGKNKILNKTQERVAKKAYKFGCKLQDIADAFGVSWLTIQRITNKTRSTQLHKRKYNDRQINVMSACKLFGLNYSDISRLFVGTDKDREKVYRILNAKSYN